MNIKPTGHHVLIKLEKVERKSAGGIIMPDSISDKEQKGAQYSTVVAVGPEAWAEHANPWAKVGDKILTGRYPGAQFDHEGDYKLYRVINDDEVIGVVE